ncbi:preprotein translocase subunit SecA [Patescibacteria group bacterium]
MSIFNKIFSDPNKKYLKEIQPQVERINELEAEFEKIPAEKLKEKTKEFKQRLKKGEALDNILPEAFALVRESAKRTLSQRHFDVQLIGGIILSQGKIAQMLTGEGKTLASTLALYLNALKEKGCHLVTVNDYLARRDTVWMGQIYHLLGLSVGCLNHERSFLYDPEYKEPEESIDDQLGDERDKVRDELGSFKVVDDFLKPCQRKEAYSADITYGTNNEFGFDYLRDNMVYDLKDQAQREFNFAIVDEVDSILIDEARTPLIISAPDTESSKWYQEFARIIPKLSLDQDYQIDEKMKAVTLTEDGINKIERTLGMKNIYEEKGIRYLHHLEQALRAQALFKKDKDYVVKNDQVIIIDEFTGRLMPGRRWSGGLHQAVEAKEGVKVQPESMTLASITFQNYFRMYEKIAGMTGTAITSAEEFDKVYNLEVVVVPTNKPMIRKDLSDQIYKTEDGKLKAVTREIKTRHEKGQPVLVGTRSVEKNEYLGKLLEKEGIPHQILNAKNHEKEGQIIAQAGKKAAVTIATNMAGRGVDIILGGNPLTEKKKKEVIDFSGLHVLGTERHEARRIDNQLQGRAGRQGDPGSTQFFVSLEDDLLRIFGSDRIKSLMTTLKIPEDEAIEANLLSGAIEGAQAKIEGMNFDARKHILEYDDVMNKHREVIYKKKKEILEDSPEKLKEKILKIIEKEGYSKEDYEKKEKELGLENMRKVEKLVFLRTLNFLWMSHLENMERVRDSVRLRAYGQQDPLVEYKNEGHKLFKILLETIEENVVQTLLKVSATSRPIEEPQVTSQKNYDVKVGKKKPGRNDPCPCGKTNSQTGKPMKYKKCCWPKFG